MNVLLIEAFVAASLDVSRSRVQVKSFQLYERNGKRTRWASGLVDYDPWIWLTVDEFIAGDWVRTKDQLQTEWKGSGE